MKKTAFILMITVVLLLSSAVVEAKNDNPGLGLLYSTKNVCTITLHAYNGFNFGFFIESAPGETREAGTSNYGRTKIGKDESTYGLDIGYSEKIARHLRLGIELSAGYKTKYSKYSDHRFTEGYYLSEEDSEFLLGAGVVVSIPLSKEFEITSSYNSIKGVSLGLTIRF